MTTLREAAQQALEAWDGGDTEWFKRAYTVMENLRAALAQQDEPVLVQGELPPRYVARSPIQAEPVEPVATLTAQRDALLEALKLARSVIGHPDDAHTQMIDATIKAVEGGA